MTNEILMKCGHTANAERDGKPVCVICMCSEVADIQPSLIDRKARCTECGCLTDSKLALPFLSTDQKRSGDIIPSGRMVCAACEMKEADPVIKDSGDRRKFESGAVRDMAEGKGRMDLIPNRIVRDLISKDHIDYWEKDLEYVPKEDFMNGITKYQESGDTIHLYDSIIAFCSLRKWQIPEMLLELGKHFEQGAEKYDEDNWKKGIPCKFYIDSCLRHFYKYLLGWTNEPHDRAVVWNLMCCIWTSHEYPELNDYRKDDKK